MRRDSESNFVQWLRQDMKSPKAKAVDWKRTKRGAFEKIGYNPYHLPHQGNYPYIKKKERLS